MRYERVKELCRYKGVTVAQAERECGFAKGSLSKIDKHKPSYEKMQTLSEYFGTTMSELFAEEKASPVYEASAGQGRLNDGIPEETISVGADDESGYVKVCGDSMYPTLQDGDVLKVDHAINDAKKIDYAVVKVNGDELTVKNVEIVDNGVWLRAENKEVFTDKFYTMQEVMTLPVTIIGRAVSIVYRSI